MTAIIISQLFILHTHSVLETISDAKVSLDEKILCSKCQEYPPPRIGTSNGGLKKFESEVEYPQNENLVST